MNTISLQNNNYSLGVLELYNSYIHGIKELDGNYLVHEKINVEDFYNDDYVDSENFLINAYDEMHDGGLKHPFILNYRNIIDNEETHSLRIIQTYESNNGELLANDKTYLLKILQKKWKKYFEERNKIIRIRSNPIELYHRRATGKWSKKCNKNI